MTTFALVPVVPGPVVEIFVGAKLFDMHPGTAAKWYVAPDDITVGATYDGNAFSGSPDMSAQKAWAAYQQQAQQALSASDFVAMRCAKANVQFPSTWQLYVSQLREIIRASSGDPTKALPTQPNYPPGT